MEPIMRWPTKVILIILLLSWPLYLEAEGPGTTSAQFLKIGIGAREVGMGEAACALSDDANSIYWNPAGLGLLKERELTAIYNIWFEDIRHGFLGYAHPFKSSTLGVAINYLDIGRMEKTRWDYPGGKGETFSATDIAGYLSCARRLREDLAVGLNLKHIQQRIEDESATGFGTDLGILYKPSNLRLGLAVQNIGTELKFIEEGYPLPLNIKAGIAYPFKNLLFALDANKPMDNEMKFSLGIESHWFKILALRLGYKTGPDHRLGIVTKTPAGLTAGVGFNLKPLRFDLAYAPYGDLGDTYRVSLLARFGEREEKVERPEEIIPSPGAKVTDSEDYTRDKTRLHVFWTEEPKAKEYQYVIGTASGGMDVLDWTSANRRTEIEASGLDLEDGKTYYITVRAKKRGLIFSKWIELGSSDGITVDFTPPATPLILDDGEYTPEGKKELHFSWSSSDEISGIKEYLYTLGTTPGGKDVVDWTSSGTETELRLADLDLKDGMIYYLSVKAIDKAGNESLIGSSDGIMVDTTPPALVSLADEGEYTTNKTKLSFDLLFEDRESGIEEIQYAIGTSPGETDVVNWKPTTKMEITESDLDLVDGKTYYLTVKAKNRAGLWSESKSSDGIIVDTTPPTAPVVVDDGETTTDTTSLHATWSSEDPESGIIEYQYALGTIPGGTDVLDWISALEKTEVEITGLSLLADKTYYLSVKARNRAGLWSEIGISDGITMTEAPVIEEEVPTLETAPPL